MKDPSPVTAITSFLEESLKPTEALIPRALIAVIGMIIVEAVIPSNLAIQRLNGFALSYANVSNLYSNVTVSSAPVPAYKTMYNILSLNPVYVVGSLTLLIPYT